MDNNPRPKRNERNQNQEITLVTLTSAKTLAARQIISNGHLTKRQNSKMSRYTSAARKCNCVRTENMMVIHCSRRMLSLLQFLGRKVSKGLTFSINFSYRTDNTFSTLPEFSSLHWCSFSCIVTYKINLQLH